MPLVECNPIAGLKNNAIGTANSLNAAIKKAVETFTDLNRQGSPPDKCNGASKRMAELILSGNGRRTDPDPDQYRALR